MGAGYGGIRVAKQLSTILSEGEDYKIILVDKHDYHTLMTQLYEPAAGATELNDAMVPLREIIDGLNVKFIKGTVENIDLRNKVVALNSGDIKIPFKYLVNALGSEPEYFNIEGLKENSISLSSLKNAAKIRCRVEKILEQAACLPPEEREITFVVGGGGLTGVEFAGELAFQLQRERDRYQIEKHHYKIILVEGSKNLLPGMSPAVYRYAQKTLEDLGVEVITGDLIQKATPETIYLASGREINYTAFIWAGGIRGSGVASKSGLKTDSRGRVLVNQFLQYVDDPYVYALGDGALVKDPKTGQPVIATAQAAMQQGNVVARNIYADIIGIKKKVYRPSLIFLLIHIGRHQAVGEPVNKMKKLKLKGFYAAWIKNLIPLKYSLRLGGFRMLFRRLFPNKNVKYELYKCNNYK
nr:NAD(P)/FAD-dependent oxidoreductase [Desulforadius tongensis]